MPLVIFGSTAVGKTKLAIELAKQLNGEIISADSMQIYRGMDIGTAKPTLEERQGIPHHLIDFRDPDEEWTVSDFVRETQTSIFKLQKEEKLPIIVGGTGLYLWSLLEGFAFPISPTNKGLRAKLEVETTDALYSKLSILDHEAAAKIHPNDKKRIIRALEVFQLTGKKMSELQKSRVSKSPHLSVGINKYSLIGLELPRDELYQRIEQRVDAMLSKGLIEEVESLLAKGYFKNITSFQALGYKEVIDYLDGKWTKDQMIEELKKRTRNFARRQMTWFRRFSAEGGSASGGKNVQWFDPSEKEKIMGACYN